MPSGVASFHGHKLSEEHQANVHKGVLSIWQNLLHDSVKLLGIESLVFQKTDQESGQVKRVVVEVLEAILDVNLFIQAVDNEILVLELLDVDE